MKSYLEKKYNLNDKDIVSAIDELSLWSAHFGIELLKIVKLKPAIKVLDIGFGLGFPFIELAMRLGNTSRLYGIDPWNAAIERAKFKINVYGIKNIDLIEGVAEDLPYEDNFFDLIISNNGINNVSDIKRTLSECSRVSKKGSQLVFTMNTEDTMMEFYHVYEEVLHKEKMFEEIKRMNEHIYSRRKPLSEIEAVVKEAKFAITQIKQDVFFFKYVDGTAMLNHFLIKVGFLEGWVEILPEDKVEFIFDKLESELNKISEKQGELKLTIHFAIFDCEKK